MFAMTEHDSPVEAVTGLLAAIAAGPSGALAERYAPEAVVELPFARPTGLRLLGREAIREHYVRAGRAPLRLIPINVVLHRTSDPALVVAAYDYAAEGLRTGRAQQIANVQLIRVERGLIARSRDFHDHRALAELMGA
jgi:uncharacterized protein